MDDKKLEETAQAIVDMFFNEGAKVSKNEYDVVLLCLKNVYKSGELDAWRSMEERSKEPTNDKSDI